MLNIHSCHNSESALRAPAQNFGIAILRLIFCLIARTASVILRVHIDIYIFIVISLSLSLSISVSVYIYINIYIYIYISIYIYIYDPGERPKTQILLSQINLKCKYRYTNMVAVAYHTYHTYVLTNHMGYNA